MDDGKKCSWCSEEFTPKRKDSKYCQRAHITHCKTCQKEISIKEMKHIPKYCSIACGSKDRSYNLTCTLCGDLFESGKSDAKFCKKVHEIPCEGCGNNFVLDPYQPARTCSRKCGATIIDFNARNAKSATTMTERYGESVTNASQLSFVKEKKRDAMMRNYGVLNPSQVEEFKEKRRKTNLERYGVENGGGAPEVQERIKKTNLEKYEVKNVSQVPEVQEKIRNTVRNRYGVPNAFLLPQAIEKQKTAKNSRVSNVNRGWKKKLDSISLQSDVAIDFDLEVKIADGLYADLGFGDVLVDINPTASHNTTISYTHFRRRCVVENCQKENHQPIAVNTHQNRFLVAEAQGKILLQYFDWMDKDIFVSIVKSKLHLDEHKAPARKCEVREISQKVANKFLKENHLLGTAKGQTFCLGLYFNGELVHVQTYGPARLNKKFEWEAIRSCSKMNWHVQGGVRRCDAFFMKSKSPTSIISYVDLALGPGATEAANPGWELLSTNKPSATWVYLGSTADLAGRPRFIRDASARRLSADRLLGLQVGEKYPTHHPDGKIFTNSDVLTAEGYVKVSDAGTRTFGWKAL